MPTTADPLTDPRFEELVAELRASRPQAPPAVRERVRAAAAATAPERTRVRPPRRRALRVAVPALAVALAVLGAAAGVRSTAPPSGGATLEEAAPAPARPELRSALQAAGDGDHSDSEAAAAEPDPSPFAPAAPPGRLQEQHVALGVRVPDVDALADATSRAMEATRSLGGYVVAAHYAVPTAEGGDSTLVVRVPAVRVQEAIARFTSLGTIASQEVRLQDLQPAYDRRAREIETLQTRIARLEQELARAADDEERARVRTQLAAARRGLEARVAQQGAAEQQGRLARIELALTTRSAPAPVDDSDRDGAAATLRQAAAVLAQLLVWLGAGLIVAGPFLALALLGLVAARSRRRALDARLLEHA